MKRTCDGYAAWISEALNGTLPPVQRGELEAHLSSCAGCRALQREMARLLALLHHQRPPDPPADLPQRIMERAWRPQPARGLPLSWWPAWQPRLTMAGAVAAALALGFWLGWRALPGRAGRAPWQQAAPVAMVRLEPGQGLLEDFMQDYVRAAVVSPLGEEALSVASLNWETPPAGP